MKEEVSLLYEEIFKKSIDSISSITDRDEKMLILTKLDEVILDSYSKGKISELHYTLLKERFSKYR